MSFHASAIDNGEPLPPFLVRPSGLAVSMPREEQEPPPAPELIRDHLEQVAILVRTLTYGELIELAAGIGADPAVLWKWATK